MKNLESKPSLKTMNRKSGILLHITSLPGKYGIGEIGPSAYKFVDELREMGQSLWQILPNNPPDNNNCPYNATSAFANNPLLISLELLVRDGWLSADDLGMTPEFNSDLVDFDLIKKWRFGLMAKAAKSFRINRSELQFKQFLVYCNQNEYWLQNYSVFNVLEKIHDGNNWIHWDSNYKTFSKDIINEIQKTYTKELDDIKILQYIFDCQWSELRSYANSKGIQIIGDIPLYISFNSADVWTNQTLFKLSNKGEMAVQSGCPPDFFVKTGQIWGHPIYDWPKHEKTGFKWWIERVGRLYEMVDIVRIDHFNGFAKYWEVPAMDKNGLNGYWVQAPGEKLLDTLIKELGTKPIVAENLGKAAPDAESLLKKFGIPGMKVLQMSFGDGQDPRQMDPNNVIYTGTHDNDTSIGWFYAEKGDGNKQVGNDVIRERKNIQKFLNLNGSEFHWSMIEFAFSTDAEKAIIPMQDILGLDSSARMNTPGTIRGNWEWRFTNEQFTNEIKSRLKTLTKSTERA